MDTISESKMATAMNDCGGMAVYIDVHCWTANLISTAVKTSTTPSLIGAALTLVIILRELELINAGAKVLLLTWLMVTTFL